MFTLNNFSNDLFTAYWSSIVLFFIILSPISSYVQSWDQSIPKDVLTTIILSINWWYILFLQYSNIDFEGGYFSNSG